MIINFLWKIFEVVSFFFVLFVILFERLTGVNILNIKFGKKKSKIGSGVVDKAKKAVNFVKNGKKGAKERREPLFSVPDVSRHGEELGTCICGGKMIVEKIGTFHFTKCEDCGE